MIPLIKKPVDTTAALTKQGEIPVCIRAPRLTGLRILVVDDSEINQIVVVRTLAREGAEFKTVTDGLQALDSLRASPQRFHLVLMDVQMPVMDGLTATRAIRGELGLTELPVIALTAGILREERRNAMNAGVNDFLLKPVNLEEMITTLLRWSSPSLPETVLPAKEAEARTALLPEQLPGMDVANRTSLLPEQLPGMDVAEGVAALQGDEKLYRKLIIELARIHGDDAAVIGAALTAGDIRQALHLAHALKGVSGNMAATTVYRAADELERALKKGELSQVEELLLRLTESLAELRTTSLLLQEEPQPSEQSDLLLDPDLTEVFLLLKKLFPMLRQRRMAALEIMQQLEELLAGTVVAPEALLLGEAVERLQFVNALTLAHELSSRLTKESTLSSPG